MSTTPGVDVTFLLPSESVTLYEPIFVNYSVENRMVEPIHLDLGLARKDNFEFSVSAGLWAHRTKSIYEQSADALYRPGTVTLAPSTVLRGRLVLSEWVAF